ncbi:SMP-30/gluconolactonase/LRE family protein [Sphingobium phenoxybenzoativorans]|uniref:SMP-30/gluconolactonase/LRE family protein n=1 Tax=Sphingobium phenoxybenzoativorans TaxID=1592790 RepID=A0A975Q1U8_9SPHN|nr:SMP-30/gluconolactonase/LRE family protein [Sphingobium phenoxybenzoativorans]QUT05758.1 SMP-30/gluconolactonase/LRE family protein [Sphingobium phenoxybenzoativorans]
MLLQTVELNASLEVVADIGNDLGEGPIWDDVTGTLVFVDSNVGRVHRFDPATGGVSHVDVGPVIGAAIPRRSGGMVASSIDGLLAVASTGDTRLLVPIEQDKPNHRMNDAKCDSRGRLLSGTLSMPFERGASALYRVDPDLSLHHVLPGVTVSNGIAWSPDETRLYYVDTSTRGIDCFDYDIETGEISGRRRFVDVDRADGFPDGITVDAEGHVWLALYKGGKVNRYDPAGRLVGQVTLPVTCVTSCNFGGEGLKDLYITTARHGLSEEELAGQPHAGALFRCRPGVSGLPSYFFAG